MFAACSGGSPGDRDNRGDFKVNLISTGRGTIYPYRIRQVDSLGNPTSTVLNIENIYTLKANVNGNNVVLPVATFSTIPDLPDGSAGNHERRLREPAYQQRVAEAIHAGVRAFFYDKPPPGTKLAALSAARRGGTIPAQALAER